MKYAISSLVSILFLATSAAFAQIPNQPAPNDPTFIPDHTLAVAVKDYCARQELEQFISNASVPTAIPRWPLMGAALPLTLKSFFVAYGKASIQPVCMDELMPEKFASMDVVRLLIEGHGVVLKVYPLPATEKTREAFYAITVRPEENPPPGPRALYYQLFSKRGDDTTPFTPVSTPHTVELPDDMQIGKLEFIIHMMNTENLRWVGSIWEPSVTGKGVTLTLESAKPAVKTAKK